MSSLVEESKHARRTTGHPLYKNERQALIQIAKTWPGHRGVNYRTTTSEDIYLLIMDAREGIVAESVNKIAVDWICHSSLDDAKRYISKANEPTLRAALKRFNRRGVKGTVTYRKLIDIRLRQLARLSTKNSQPPEAK